MIHHRFIAKIYNQVVSFSISAMLVWRFCSCSSSCLCLFNQSLSLSIIIAAKTLLPFGLLLAAGFLAAPDPDLRAGAAAQADPFVADAAAGFFFLLCAFILFIHDVSEARSRA